MSDQKTTTTVEERSGGCRWSVLSGLGLVFGIVAFLLAALSPWAVAAFADQQPRAPAEPEEEVDLVKEVAQAVKRKLRDKLRGEKEEEEGIGLEIEIGDPPDEPREINWTTAIPIGVGAIGVCLGVGGFVRSEDPRLSMAASGLSLAAMILQYFLIITAVILAILVLGTIAGALGGGG